MRRRGGPVRADLRQAQMQAAALAAVRVRASSNAAASAAAIADVQVTQGGTNTALQQEIATLQQRLADANIP